MYVLIYPTQKKSSPQPVGELMNGFVCQISDPGRIVVFLQPIDIHFVAGVIIRRLPNCSPRNSLQRTPKSIKYMFLE